LIGKSFCDVKVIGYACTNRGQTGQTPSPKIGIRELRKAMVRDKVEYMVKQSDGNILSSC